MITSGAVTGDRKIITANVDHVQHMVWDRGVPAPYVYLGRRRKLEYRVDFAGRQGVELSVGFQADDIYGDATNIETTETDDFELVPESSVQDVGDMVLKPLQVAG